MIEKNIIPVILAGGQGTRLWPASLPHIPKQFITFGEQSIIVQAILKAKEIAKSEIIIVTGEQYLPLFSTHLEEELTQVGIDTKTITLIGEPQARNTAPAIALATRYVLENSPESIMLVMTADHLISPATTFAEDVDKASSIVQHASDHTWNSKVWPIQEPAQGSMQVQHGCIVTFGIPPNRPETGYGYIEEGEELYSLEGDTIFGKKVQSFKEKPNLELAKEYCAQGNVLWNSGMFCFSAKFMAQEFARYCEQLHETIIDITHNKDIWTIATQQFRTIIPTGIDFASLEKQSIDYAVMEHTLYVAIVQARFEWYDVGSWDDVSMLLDQKKIPSLHKPYIIEAQNTTVYSDIPVGVCGISDAIVVIKNNKALVIKKDMGQSVGDIAKKDSQN